MSSLKTAWITKASANEKPWGNEVAWTGGYAGNVKTITLEKGCRTSFKINNWKDEMLICGSGKVLAYFCDEETVKLGVGQIKTSTMLPGTALIVQSGCPYRIEALETATILEVSSTSNSVITRLHDDYGRETSFVNDHLDKLIKNMWG